MANRNINRYSWEQRKLGETVDFYNGDRSSRYPKDSDMVSEGIPFINAGDIVSGRVKIDTANKITEEKYNELSGAKIKRGDIIYCLRGTLGKNAFVDNFDVGTVASSLVDIRPKNIVGMYLFQVLNSDIEYRQRTVNDEGAAQPNLSAKNLSLFKIPLPTYDEQEKIALYFESLDNLITLHQRKYDVLCNVKKSMLEKMFPKNGEKVPKLRFEGFEDDWEQRKLVDEFENFIVPMRDKPKEFGGNIPWTRIEDIEGKYLNGSLSGQYVTRETIDKMNLKVIPKDSLIVSTSATFGVVAVITQDLITNQTFIGLVPKEKITLDYWYSFFHSHDARRYMKLQSAGSTIFYIARESFENMPVKVPSKEEMVKIGECFEHIDNLITLHQRELEKLKNIKKSCLEKMFV